MKIITFLMILLGAVQLCLSANILFLVPMPAKSHYNLGDRLVRELIKRGHQVTIISAFQMSKPPKGLTEIIIPELDKKFSQSLRMEQKEGKFSLRNLTPLAFLFFSKVGEIMLDSLMEMKPVQDLMKSNQKFDLVIGECFLIEGLLGGFSHRFNAPMAAIATFMPNTWPNAMIGNPAHPAYIPEPILPYTNKMNFLQRTINVLYGVVAQIFYYHRHLPMQDSSMRKHFGDHLPPLKDILSKTSLVLVNHHYSVAFPRAYHPNMVEVGGYHIKPPEPLPNDLKTYMDDARDGVIFFSMGSNIPSSDFPDEKIQGILKAFSKLKQRVLWKFEKENFPNLPKNVKISKWLPQNDILAHPNLKLFITHGGLLSITEAVMRGVPLVAIPIFGDQPSNINFVVELGLGVQLEYEAIKEETLTSAINEVLSNTKYAKNMKQRSVLLQDVPISQIDNAVFWVEYVIRHKGAPHLRSTAQDLSWYQLYLLDVIGFLGLVFFLVLFILWKFIKYCIGFFAKKKLKSSSSSAKKKN